MTTASEKTFGPPGWEVNRSPDCHPWARAGGGLFRAVRNLIKNFRISATTAARRRVAGATADLQRPLRPDTAGALKYTQVYKYTTQRVRVHDSGPCRKSIICFRPFRALQRPNHPVHIMNAHGRSASSSGRYTSESSTQSPSSSSSWEAVSGPEPHRSRSPHEAKVLPEAHQLKTTLRDDVRRDKTIPSAGPQEVLFAVRYALRTVSF